jgi:hypothetical protein
MYPQTTLSVRLHDYSQTSQVNVRTDNHNICHGHYQHIVKFFLTIDITFDATHK